MKRLVILIGIISLTFPNVAICQWANNGIHIYNTNAGFVGIGTDTPLGLLYVMKNTTEPMITIRNTGGAGGASYSMIDDGSGADWKFKATMFGGFKIRDHANSLDVVVIEPNSAANSIYISEGGKVGIGTSNPTAKFEVQGLGSFKVNQTDILPGAIYAERNGGSVLALRNTDISVGHTPIIRFERGDGSGQAAYIDTHENDANGIDKIGFSITGVSSCLYLLANGNVGINTTTPQSKLSVNGGDVNILDIGSGIIMKSPNGQCWRVTIDNSGNLIRTSITCP